MSTEHLVYVVAGAITINDASQAYHQFYAVDFFVLPKGFIGAYKCEGHGLFRSMIIKKAD